MVGLEISAINRIAPLFLFGFTVGMLLEQKLWYTISRPPSFVASGVLLPASFISGLYKWVFPKIGGKPPQIMNFNRIFHEIFTIHFGGFSPYFWKHPNHHRTPTFNKPRISISWHKNYGKEKPCSSCLSSHR